MGGSRDRAPERSGVAEGDGPGPRAQPGRPDGNAFDLLTFDCYGTLIDWEAGIVRAARSVCASHGVVASDAALLHGFAEAEHRVQSREFRSYRGVLALTLDRMAASLGFVPTDAQCRAFAASVGDWPPFADTSRALARLGRRFRLGIVSNVDDDLFGETARHLGADIEWVVTAEQVGSYKPDPAHFREMELRSGVPRERTLHIAQSLFHDIAPASALGYRTLHVDRPTRGSGHGATPPSAARPDWRVSSLEDAARLLVAGSGPR